jgi:hypothetical protein
VADVTTIGWRGRGTPRSASTDDPGERRIEAARRGRAWTELDPADLFERERGYIVSATTDECFLPYRGDAFSRSGMVVSDMTPLAFYVAGDDVVVLERQPQMWSEIVYQRERARAR